MADRESLNDYRDALFEGALNAGGHDNITMALFECVSVDTPEMERTLSATVKPKAKKGKFWIFAVALALLAALAYFAGTQGWLDTAVQAIQSFLQEKSVK